MKKLLLILIFSSFLCCVSAQIQDIMYCKQYTVVANADASSTFGTPVCYFSQVEIRYSRGNITITTDSLSVIFVIVHRSSHPILRQDHSKFLAYILGQPGQVYAINERKDELGHYYLSCIPTKFTERSGVIAGTALEISNVNICK